MSRQSKQAKRRLLAAEFTALHKGGQRGPGRTDRPAHSPRKGYRVNDQRIKALAAFMAGLRNRVVLDKGEVWR